MKTVKNFIVFILAAAQLCAVCGESFVHGLPLPSSTGEEVLLDPLLTEQLEYFNRQKVQMDNLVDEKKYGNLMLKAITFFTASQFTEFLYAIVILALNERGGEELDNIHHNLREYFSKFPEERRNKSENNLKSLAGKYDTIPPALKQTITELCYKKDAKGSHGADKVIQNLLFNDWVNISPVLIIFAEEYLKKADPQTEDEEENFKRFFDLMGMITLDLEKTSDYIDDETVSQAAGLGMTALQGPFAGSEKIDLIQQFTGRIACIMARRKKVYHYARIVARALLGAQNRNNEIVEKIALALCAGKDMDSRTEKMKIAAELALGLVRAGKRRKEDKQTYCASAENIAIRLKSSSEFVLAMKVYVALTKAKFAFSPDSELFEFARGMKDYNDQYIPPMVREVLRLWKGFRDLDNAL